MGGASGATSSGGAANAGGTSGAGAANGGGGGDTGTGGASAMGGASAVGGDTSMGGASAMGGDTSSGGASCTAATGTAGSSAMNLLSNGSFDNCSYSPWWGSKSSDMTNPSDYVFDVSTHQLCTTMVQAGKNPWDVIVGYSGIHLVANTYYHIKFTASADVDRTIKFKTGFGDTPYTDYFIEKVPISTTPQTIEFTYLNLREDPMGQFQYQIGGTPGKVCIDDIVVEPVAEPTTPAYTTPAHSNHPFKDYKAIVKMGTAVDTPIFLSNPLHNAIVAGEFSMITPANSMKMNLIQPTQGKFDFTDTDALFDWAQKNNLEFRGHPLVWHTQAPSWLTTETPDVPWTPENMTQIMYDHIDALMGRYKGKFPYWDVVNEAIDNPDGTWGFRKTFWHERIGDNFIDLAFQRAHMDDPDAVLLYNDYNIEQKGNGKADKVFQMISDMKSRGIPINGVGFQGHYFINADGGTSQGVPNIQAIRDNMARYAEIGIEVQITECDFRIGKPLDDNKTMVQNKFYADMLQACIDAPNCSHFTVWGLSDLDSWVPGTFPDMDFAHLWDKSLMPKPAYFAMSDVFAKYNTDGTLIGGGGGVGGGGGASSGGGASALGGTTATTTPAAESKKSGGCSIDARPSEQSSSWAVAALALLGAVWSRRSKRAGS